MKRKFHEGNGLRRHTTGLKKKGHGREGFFPNFFGRRLVESRTSTVYYESRMNDAFNGTTSSNDNLAVSDGSMFVL